MKVTAIKPIEPITSISKIRKSSETGVAYVTVDRSELSSEGTIMSKVYQSAFKDDETRKEKLETIKKQVAEGIYKVNENMVSVIIASMVGHTA